MAKRERARLSINIAILVTYSLQTQQEVIATTGLLDKLSQHTKVM